MSIDKQIMRSAAVQLHLAGYHVVALDWGKKKHFFRQPHPLNVVEINYWFTRLLLNIGIMLGKEVLPGLRLMAVDCDDNQGERWAEQNGIITGTVADVINITSRGLHALMITNVVTTNKIKYRPGVDLLFNGHVCSAPSWNEEKQWRYSWKNGLKKPGELRMFPGSLLVDRPVRKVKVEEANGNMVTRARRYLATVEGGISGQGRQNKAMRVAGILIQKFGLTIDQAWPLYLEWNEKCAPPLTEMQLQHKLEDSLKNKAAYQVRLNQKEIQ